VIIFGVEVSAPPWKTRSAGALGEITIKFSSNAVAKTVFEVSAAVLRLKVRLIPI
jgi:hypothetical protein